jgi:TPR repeat protein
MPAALADLERDLAAALRSEDADRIRAARRVIAEQHPDTAAGAECAFRLGIAAVLGEGDADAAIEWLRIAAKAKHPRWTPEARLSLGTLLFRQAKVQQAMFELRKVAGLKPPTLASARALGLIALFSRAASKKDDAERAEREQRAALEALGRDEDPETRGLAAWMLGMELAHAGERIAAKAALERALASGGLGAEETAKVKASLARL